MLDFIPAAATQTFSGGIRHPHLYLWDAWSYVEAETIHLYCLAVSRTRPDGEVLDPAQRNGFPFHVRHFLSVDDGATWRDHGCCQQPNLTESGHDAGNVWSGSIKKLDDGKKLVAYTGLYDLGEQRGFLQNISLAHSSDGHHLDWLQAQPLSCPVRDREQILAQGYYLDKAEKLGHNDGENGGPIMAWRDPFVIDSAGQQHIFWSAKTAAGLGAIAHGLLEASADGYTLAQLYCPIQLPDGDDFTQIELPKFYHDEAEQCYYLIVATCNRIFEGQPDSEVDKVIRIYRATSLRGPWQSIVEDRSAVIGCENLYGMTVLKTDFNKQRLLCMAPYTDGLEGDLSLSFPAPFYLDLKTASVMGGE